VSVRNGCYCPDCASDRFTEEERENLCPAV
jgi:hypothetical protein